MKDEISDFLKFAYEHGKIKEVSDAIKEYPPIEEWHQGKIENVIKESSVIYGSKYGIGDIVFVKEYGYSDGTKGINHLFVIIDRNNLVVPIENFCMLISSQMNKLKYASNKSLPKDDNNHLNRDSIVKTDVLYKIIDDQILFKVGEVDYQKIKEYKNYYYEINKK